MIIRRIRRKFGALAFGLMWRLRLSRRPFAEYQRIEMNRRSELDPREAVGGLWDEMGDLQLAVLNEHGLTAESTVLDVGCGSLRGGRKLIPHLQPGNYWGTEISDGLLEAGRELVVREGLAKFQPNLVHASDFSYNGVRGQKFSHILFFGVFTDLPPESIEKAMSGLSDLMTHESVVLATFGLSNDHTADYRYIRFMQPFSFYERLAAESELEVQMVPEFSHRHPKGHSLLRMRLARSTERKSAV